MNLKLLIAAIATSLMMTACSNSDKKAEGEAKAKALYDRAKAASKTSHQDLNKEVDKIR